MRKCSKCGIEKEDDCFKLMWSSRRNKYIYQSWCIECKRELDRGRIRAACGTDKYAEIQRVYTQRRSSKLHGKIDRLAVFKRAKWRCESCNVEVVLCKVNSENKATIDHVIPLSKGGVHSYSNIQCLCRLCNQKKNNRIVGQQKIMI